MTMIYVQDKTTKKIHVAHTSAAHLPTTDMLCGEKLGAAWQVRDETENGNFASCLACRDKAGGK